MAQFRTEGATLHVVGDLDAKDLDEFEHACDQLVESTAEPELLLDFSEVEYMASVHIGVLMSFRHRITETGRRFRLRPSRTIRALLEMTGANESLLLTDD